MRTHLGCMLLVALVTSPALARTWTDNTGKYRLEGEFAHSDATKAYLRTAAGKLMGCRLDRLSKADAAHVKALVARDLEAPRPEALATAAMDDDLSLPPAPVLAVSHRTAQAERTLTVVRNPARVMFASQQHEAIDTPESADYKPKFRNYVYKGCCGTWHLYRASLSVPIVKGSVGTGHYCRKGHWWLAYLEQINGPLGNLYLYYRPTSADKNTTEWAFSKHQWCGCYLVWRKPAYGVYYIFDHASRERPW